eukprot:10752327-Alexandrium_andersonii.AAC.1
MGGCQGRLSREALTGGSREALGRRSGGSRDEGWPCAQPRKTIDRNLQRSVRVNPFIAGAAWCLRFGLQSQAP